jgi:predicted ATPase
MAEKDFFNSGYRVAVKEYSELDLGHPMAVSIMNGNIIDDELDIPRHFRNLKSQKRLVLWEEANDIEVQPLDIGVGISQVLPVIVAALQARSGFVIIEQPELHIHPALQVSLGDLFIEQIQKNPDLIFILETHSEHMMLRFLRRIRETSENTLPPEAPPLTPDKLSIYFSEKKENGISITPIRVDEDGDFIDRWPQGFFNERFKEIY